MLVNFFRGGFDVSSVISFLLSIPVIVIAFSIHEFAHGFVAYRLGDPTARNLGRLTMNPLKHIDPIGAVLMLVCGIGYAKPVPINTRYFKNPKWGMAITALAGPLANFILGFVAYMASFLISTKINYMLLSPAIANFVTILSALLFVMAYMNVSLAVFNLIIPIPPFDGSRILFTFLPTRIYFAIMKYERIIMYAIMFLIFFGSFGNIITYVVGAVLRLFDAIAFTVF